MPTTMDELLFDASDNDLYVYLLLLLKHYASLTIYIIEPYVAQNADVLIIPVGDNYSIYDYGGRLVITPNDIFQTPLFAITGLLDAIDQAIEMLIDAGTKEIAILGDMRAKCFVWDKCERLENALKLINFQPLESFTKTRSAIVRYLEDQGSKLKARLKTAPKSTKTKT